MPFFAGACLDPGIQASSRVLQYIFRMFAKGDAALPSQGMGDIPRQLTAKLPQGAVRLNCKAIHIDGTVVTLADGSKLIARKVVIATSQPALEHLLGQKYLGKEDLENQVRSQCIDWFGNAARDWDHLHTYHIEHALPHQEPPTPDPYQLPDPVGENLRVCGEHQSLPGIQWSLLSGRKTAEAIVEELC